MYTCTLHSPGTQLYQLYDWRHVTSLPGTLLPGNTGGIEETIRGRYSCRQPLVNALSSFLRHPVSYEVSGDAIVCFVVMKFFLRVSNTS